MKNKLQDSFKKILPFLLIGLLGYVLYSTISNDTNIGIYDLKVYHDSLEMDDEYLDFVNRIGLASFEGSWEVVGSDEKILNEVNAVKIDCWLDIQTCNVAQANIYTGDFFDGQFANNISYYEISNWTEDGQITAITKSPCEKTVLKADIKTRIVTLTESKLEDAKIELCAEGNTVLLKLSPRNYDF